VTKSTNPPKASTSRVARNKADESSSPLAKRIVFITPGRDTKLKAEARGESPASFLF
jgi:hypothetical protein